MTEKLMPRLPTAFTLRSEPAGVDYDVVFETPTARKSLGRFSPADLNATVLLRLFPDWKPTAMVRMGLAMLTIPPQFSMTAEPEGGEILFALKLDGPTPRSWSKRVPVQDWTLAQMGEVASFIRQSQSSPQPQA